MALPKSLVLELKKKFEVETFIETGTYYGNTAVWASSHFNTITIEYARTIYDRTVEKYRHITNINFLFGDSKVILKEIIPKLTQPAVIWLDGHWSAGETYGEGDECPVIGEIQSIVDSKYPHFIFIDDAHLFLSPPPKPHKIEEWPSIDMVISALISGKHTYYIIISDNVIVAVPDYAKAFVSSYYQENNPQWKEPMAQSKTRKFSSLLRTIASLGHKSA